MADANDDEWLYGAEGDNDESETQEELLQEEPSDEIVVTKNGNIEMSFDEHNFEEAGDHEHLIADESKDGNDDESRDEQDKEDDSDDDDDDDDDINVVIGDIKSGGPSARFDPKQKQPGSKFNIEEFESVGTINGQPSIEFAIESIEDKPWRKPGADITDYFNYGFNEETWRAYCERQKRMRIHESGVGLASLTAAQQGAGPPGQGNEMGGPIMSSGGPRPGINIGFKRGMMGPRPPRQLGIDVIGAPSQNPIRAPAPRENVIQVMTADRREYSRTVVNQSNLPLAFNVPPEEFYNHEEQDAFNYGYEPTQDSQWNPGQSNNPNWVPGEIKELTPMNQPPPGMNLNIPPPLMGMGGGGPRMPMMNPQMIQPLMGGPPMNIKQEPDDKRDMRGGRMGYRDMRDDRRYDNDRKRRERSSSRDRKYDRTRDDRDRSRGDRYARDSSRRRSKSRDKKRSRSRSRDKSKRSKSKDRKDDKDSRSSSRRNDDKSSKRSSVKEEKV